ncbi:Daunorubicin/doxorubicin resistance ATP-binding protein DrrA [compost metagenome]
MNAAISVKNLQKNYGSVKAVNDISFEVKQGSIFAFLGTNGAGKSTTISCLTTTTAPSHGEIIINGKTIGRDDSQIRKAIGVVFQTSLLDPSLTVRENLEYRASFYGLGEKTSERIETLAEMIDLNSFIDRPYGPLSGGQKRRADIARALLHSPSILFLDEPTAGLDPKSREQVWQTIYQLQTSIGLTVFLTTHYMEETERADDVYVINKGVKIASGTPQTLRAAFSQNELRIEATDHEMFEKLLTKDGVAYEIQQSTFLVATKNSAEALEILKKYEGKYIDFEFRHGNMDDVFLKLTGSPVQESEKR